MCAAMPDHPAAAKGGQQPLSPPRGEHALPLSRGGARARSYAEGSTVLTTVVVVTLTHGSQGRARSPSGLNDHRQHAPTIGPPDCFPAAGLVLLAGLAATAQRVCALCREYLLPRRVGGLRTAHILCSAFQAPTYVCEVAAVWADAVGRP